MNQDQVVALMSSSRNSEDWNANADEVKRKCGGYPSFWYSAIMMSGLAHRVQQSWVETAASGILPKSNPHETADGVMVFTLNPPTPDEIAEIRRNQA